VRELGVGVEGGFVEPFGMNRVRGRFAEGLEKMNAEATGFGARGSDNAEEFVMELLLFAWERFETDEDVKWHGGVE
jgi:hypothetical protein